MNVSIRPGALPRRLLPLLALAAVGIGCGAATPRPSDPAAAVAAAPAPPVLTRSPYSKDSSGSLTENDLQRVLESPIDLQFPARVGVVPLARPFDASGPVAIGVRGIASDRLARGLLGSPHFSHVSDISTDLPNVGGLEGLRVIAARYRLRYLLLYSERFEDETHLNGWAWTYPTIVGMFVAPGVTVASKGIAQADLFDVRTGTVLFSVVEPMEVSEQHWIIGAAREHQSEQLRAAAHAAERLAKRVVSQTNALVAWADRAADGARVTTRILPAPVVAGASATEPASPVR